MELHHGWFMGAYANEAELTYSQLHQKVNCVFLAWFFFLEGVFFAWMLPLIIFQYLVSDIIQAKHQVLRSCTTEVSARDFFQSALD